MTRAYAVRSVLVGVALVVVATVALHLTTRSRVGEAGRDPQWPPSGIEIESRPGAASTARGAPIPTSAYPADPGAGLRPPGNSVGLRGVVVSETTSNGVAFARIRPIDPTTPSTSEGALRSVSADSNGSFLLALPGERREIALVVAAEGFATTELRGISVDPAIPESDLGAILLSPARTLRGRVEDETGLPLGDAVVTASSRRSSVAPFEAMHGPERVPLSRSTTDAEGRFALENLAPGFHRVVARIPGYAQATFAAVAIPQEGEPPPLVLRLVRAADLEGTVVDAEGRAVAAAAVDYVVSEVIRLGLSAGETRSPTGETVATDSEGRFGLAPRPDIAEGSVALRIRHPDFRSVEVPVGPDEPGPLRITLPSILPRGNLEFHGSLVDRVTRAVVGGRGRARISTPGVDEGRVVEVVDGHFSVTGLAATSYRIELSHAGYRPHVIEHPLSVETSRLVVELDPGRELRGRVRDALSSNPIAGATVRHEADAPAITAEDGSFVLRGLPEERWSINAFSVSAEGYLDASPVVPAPEGKAPATVEIRLRPTSELRTLEGRVTSEAQSVAGAEVSLRIDLGSLQWVHTRSRADGRFSFPRLHPESLRHGVAVRVRHPRHAEFMREVGATEIERPLELELDPGAPLAGRVVDTSGGPVPDARVLVALRRAEPFDPRDRYALLDLDAFAGTTTDADGRFRFEHLPAVPLRVVPAARGYAPPEGESEEAYAATPAPGAFRILRLERGWSVSGRTVDDTGQAAVGLPVEAAGTGHLTTTDDDGRFALDGLLAASVEIRVRSPHAVGASTVARGRGDGILLRVARVGTVAGRLVDAAGRGVAGRTLRVRGTERRATSGEDGRFRLDLVPIGAAILEWDRPGGEPGSKPIQVVADGVTDLGELIVG